MTSPAFSEQGRGFIMKRFIIVLSALFSLLIYSKSGYSLVIPSTASYGRFGGVQKRGIASDGIQFKMRRSAKAWGNYPEVVIPEGYYKIPGEERGLAENQNPTLDDVFGANEEIPEYENYGANEEKKSQAQGQSYNEPR